MEGRPDQVEQKEFGPEESRHTKGVRHILDRVGNIVQWHTDRGALVQEGKGYHIDWLELLATTVKSFLRIT